MTATAANSASASLGASFTSKASMMPSKGSIPALDHEVWDAAVHDAAFEVELLARSSDATLASTQASEVLGRLGDHICFQRYHDPANCTMSDQLRNYKC